jgi:tetrahydromethanopterin S-methyltransferase subunit G
MTLTPEQFNKLATKEDLKKFYTKNEMDEKFDKVLTAVDGVAKKLENIETELLSNQVAHDRFENRFVIIEKRLDKVEAKVIKK